MTEASRDLKGGLKAASRGLQGGFKGASPSEGFKGRGLQGGLKSSESEGGFERLEGGFEGSFKGA